MTLYKFYFKIKTPSGGIIGNVVIEAHNQFDAQTKLQRRYPNCTILECRMG